VATVGAVSSGEVDGDLRAIGQAARECGVSVRALRYYQEMGLIKPSHHTSGGNRLYAESDLVRVRRIRELQELLGFNLDEIREILTIEDQLTEYRNDYRATSDDLDRARIRAAALAAYGQLRADIDRKIGRLTAFRDEVDGRIDRIQRPVEVSG
jgi:DNA-binding transcriptional MerR regulator